MPGPGRNGAPPNPDLFPANNPVLRPPVSGQGRPVGEDRHDQLLQRLRRQPEVRSITRAEMTVALILLLRVRCAVALAGARAVAEHRRSIVVVVIDQSGAVVKDAKVSVINSQTGAVREAMSGSDGSATFPALSLTGTYTVTVSKPGFGDESATTSRCAPARPRR